MRHRVAQVLLCVFGSSLLSALLCVAVMTVGVHACRQIDKRAAAVTPHADPLQAEIDRLRADIRRDA